MKDIGWYLTGVDITQITYRYYPICQLHIKADAQGTWRYQYGSDILTGTIVNGNMLVPNQLNEFNKQRNYKTASLPF